MPLRKKPGTTVPRDLGLFWQMLAEDGTPVDIYVFANTLQAFDSEAIGPVGLLKRHRALLEEVASRKFDEAGPGGHGPLEITLADLKDVAREAAEPEALAPAGGGL
jgi:hypothetical protein